MRYVLLFSLLAPLVAMSQRADTVVAPPAKTAKGGYVIGHQELRQIVDMASQPEAVVGNVRTFDHRYQGMKGTPYLLPYWAKGYVMLTNGQRYDRGLLKFNAYQQELVMIQPPAKTDSIVIDRERISWFVIQPADSGSAIVFRHFTNLRSNDQELLDSYYRVIYSGSHPLLQRISKQFRPANYKDVYSPDIRYDAFIDKSAYYVLNSDRRIVKVKLSTKSLLAAVTGDVDTKVPESIGDLRKRVVTSEEDAVKLLSAYDQLTAAK
ncbi:hypothetical protein [Spirosoma pomorum]